MHYSNTLKQVNAILILGFYPSVYNYFNFCIISIKVKYSTNYVDSYNEF